MTTQMKTTKTRITIALISITLSLVCSVSFMNILGLSILDSIQILTNKEPFPIYLNTSAFRSAQDAPNSAWFVIDQHSLSPITEHSIKAYKTRIFKPEIPNAYYPFIRKENRKLLSYSGLFFILACGVWFYGLNKTFGKRYAESFFLAGRNSVGDPTQPYVLKIDELEKDLQMANSTIRDLKGKLTVYAQEKGPIKVMIKIITSDELKACKKLGISPEEYLEKHKAKRGSGDSEGKVRERVRF